MKEVYELRWRRGDAEDDWGQKALAKSVGETVDALLAA